MIHLPECKDVPVIHKLSTRLHENNKRISKVKNNDGINKQTSIGKVSEEALKNNF